MEIIKKIYMIMIINIIFFAISYFTFWGLSVSYLFDFTQIERKIFWLISSTSLTLMFPTTFIMLIIVGRKSPQLIKSYAEIKRNFKSLKKIQKCGLIIMISGLIFLAIGFIVPIYLRFFYGFVPFEPLFIIIFYIGPDFFLSGLTLFLIFFGRKKWKRAKTWSDLFKDEET